MSSASIPGGCLPGTSSDVSTDMNMFKGFVKALEDPNSKDEIKLKAALELTKNLETILNSPLYPAFLEYSVPLLLKFLEEGDPYFISEYNIQQVRKLVLEILHRLPMNETLRPFVKSILTLMLKLLEIDNEENILICLRIINELHKQYRPPFSPEVLQFLRFVKGIYERLPENLPKIFEIRTTSIACDDLSDLDITEILKQTFTTQPIQVRNATKTKDGNYVTYRLLPRATLSLKVLQELPIIVVLMYQLYKANIQQEITDLIPLVLTTIQLQPSTVQRNHPNFNREVFVDFMGAQVKTLSFLAFIVKMYQKTIGTHAVYMVHGMLGLLTLCPQEVAHLRRELLIATRLILATDLRIHFVPHMERLFDEDVLLGRGWTTHESLRPLAYSTLADLVHHVRQHLQLKDLTRAVHLFSKNIHDESLATNIQTVSCKLLLNLVDCIRVLTESSTEPNDLMVKMLEVFVLKFKTITKTQLPVLIAQSKQNKDETRPVIKSEDVKPTDLLEAAQIRDEQQKQLQKYGAQPPPNISDYRALVKTLILGVKTVTFFDRKPHETQLYIRLVKWAMLALDIFTIPIPGVKPTPEKTKEEKDVLEHFFGIFSMIKPETFREIFSTTIDFVIERIHKNSSLQTIIKSFLTNPSISPIFATILVEYLLERMEDMGNDPERSKLHLELFKLVFGSVTLFPNENENMLRPHLHRIVNQSMELALTAKDPFNYFSLLRILFRSIGTGSHDLLYQEFLPLLPSLLEGLNRLQSGLHKQKMKDLFVELCLTVPVRLSSLLPYLPMLMDPLVSALNGSQLLVSQGLKTLELCVDNLQPDFLYEHIQPVRADLMQALWKALRNNDHIAQAAFKILGKFGGANRKMLIEPQRLEWVDTESSPPCIVVNFLEHPGSINLPVHRVIETAFSALKHSGTQTHYRLKAWDVIHSYLAASLETSLDEQNQLYKLLTHPSFREGPIMEWKGVGGRTGSQARDTHQTALTGMFVAVAIKELNAPVFQTMVKLVRHYTMIAVVQQAGPFAKQSQESDETGNTQLDPLVLVDALGAIMGYEEKELCKPGCLAIGLILETASSIVGGRERVCKLPLVEYLTEVMVRLCYERAWYTKLGGCLAIRFLCERMSLRWVYDHLFMFLKALIFVMMDLQSEVSSGAVDQAKFNLDRMLMISVTPPTVTDEITNMDELVAAQQKALYEVTHELVRQVTSPHDLVREQSIKSLRLLAEKQGMSVTDVIRPHRDVLADMIPPKKHLLRHQPVNAQIGLMDGNTFCTTLEPRLFTINLTVKEHNIYVRELIMLCESEDTTLAKLPCYKNVTDFIPLRRSALRALSSCQYLESQKYCDNIFNVLYKTLENYGDNLQEVAYECIKKFISVYNVDMKIVHDLMRPLLTKLVDYSSLNLKSMKVFLYLTQLFPSAFNEKFCEQLLEILRKLFESVVQDRNNTELIRKITTIIEIFHQTPSASCKFITELIPLVLQTELSMMMEASSPFRVPLLKFLVRYPVETLEYFLNENRVIQEQYSRHLEFILRDDKYSIKDDQQVFRSCLGENFVPRLLLMLQTDENLKDTDVERIEIRFQTIRIISLLIKVDKNWLLDKYSIISSLNKLWSNDTYLERHKKVDTVRYRHWKEPKLVCKILLHDFVTRPGDSTQLFHLLRAFINRFIPSFQFLKDFIENEVAQKYSVQWKRQAFFDFVELWTVQTISQELKSKILQMVLIPCFQVSFQRGETVELLGSEPQPDIDTNDNIVSVFINHMIDPDRPFGCADCVRISLLQFACLLVEFASPYIHNAANKQHGHKVRRLMTFAWPCLLGKNYVDPVTRYHGHILLSHIIDKFAIHRKIILQVFHSLLTAHAMEAKQVVRQALDILTPSVPVRVEEGNTMFTHWTKKIIVEEGHSVQQLLHILQIIVRHFRVYYPVRHHIVQYMIGSIQRLGFSPTATIEHRKLAFELAEVIIKWELMRLKDETESTDDTPGVKRSMTEQPEEQQRRKIFLVSNGSVPSPQPIPTETTQPIDKNHANVIINFLLRLACQVNETTPSPVQSPGEILSRRCVQLLKIALKPDVWPQQCDLKLGFMDKIFTAMDGAVGVPGAGYSNACVALELLTFLLGVMSREQILTSFRPLQRGLSTCVVCTNSKIVQLMHNFLGRLMGQFPPNLEEPVEDGESIPNDFEPLYSNVWKMISDGLSNYEKNLSASPSSLFGTLMMLKAACGSNESYIDRLIIPFMKVLHRMVREHLTSTTPDGVSVDLLILSLDLVKTRVVVMGVEMRKTFIGSILIGLIEKTTDVKIMKAIIKILEDWMKSKNPVTLSQAPSMREKSILLVKLMGYVEKRFQDDTELQAQFLELINFIYRDRQLRSTELCRKLEPGFLAGLRCPQPTIRAKFFELFDESMKRRAYDRLMYIIRSQNWDGMGSHYWIKQCIELLIATTRSDPVALSTDSIRVPPICSVISTGSQQERDAFELYSSDISPDIVIKEEHVEELDDSNSSMKPTRKLLPEVLTKHSEFLTRLRETTSEQFLLATVQLCHIDTELAESIWLELFPKLWKILEPGQRSALAHEILPFVTSGANTNQTDCHPTTLNTFIEALSRCEPPVNIPPAMTKYIAKSHNLYHRMTLSLEKQSFKRQTDDLNTDDLLDSLGELYWSLREEDLWAGLWEKHSKYPETNTAIGYELQGFFEQAQSAYESCISKFKQDSLLGNTTQGIRKEMELWSEHWVRCAKELNQWDGLLEYAKRGHYDPYLMLESSWHVSNWEVMKEVLSNIEYTCSKEQTWKVTLFGGYLAICHPKEKHLYLIDRYVKSISTLCINEWKRLPNIVSHIHLELLQSVQLITELQEAVQLYQGLTRGNPSSLHDMNAIVKTWRNRLPVISDDLTHWSDVFTWRQHHYHFIAGHFETPGNSTPKPDVSTKPSMVGVHASAEAIIHFAKIARKHNLPSVCLDSLSQIYTIPSVPIVDCFQKIRQQVKCHLLTASLGDNNSLHEALKALLSTNVAYFHEMTGMTAELYALKGMVRSLIGSSEEANKEFSAAVQHHYTLIKAWALYGDYLEQVFVSNLEYISMGESAITCFLHACRHQNESKARKYLSKVLWLLSYDDSKGSLMNALEKYNVGVPPMQWLPWIPQLLNCLVQYNGNVIINLLTQVGRMFPQAVYFPIRTLYLTLRIEERERYKMAERNQTGKATEQPGEIVRATPSMWRCSKIMHFQRDFHPTVICSLEGIVDQMVWFRENWYEEVLRQLRQGLAKCYGIAFENRDSVNEAKITQHIFNFVKKLVSTFGIGVENINNSGGNQSQSSTTSSNFISAASESLARRAEATYQDPVFREMKEQFTSDFSFTQPGSIRLHNLISKLKKWIRILEKRSKILIRSFLIEEKCRYLSNFSLKTAEVELPGEFLLPKHSHYYVRIARFMPQVDVVQKHNTAARRLYIRGHNGRIYPYLMVTDSGLTDARREERVLQLLRMLNHYLGRQKETSRRLLHFTIPRVVAVSPQMRLVEDNPESISLLDIYRKSCKKLNVEHDSPISYYYERLANLQARTLKSTHQVYRDILRGVQSSMVPKTLLREWAVAAYPGATDYFHFRKIFTLQLALACFAEYILHLTRLNPDMMYLHRDSGLINISYFKFDIDDATGRLDDSRPVPFRLTPNLVDFLTPFGISGPLTSSIIAAARCLVYPNFKVVTILKTVLKDEMTVIAACKTKKENCTTEGETQDAQNKIIVEMVTEAVGNITKRLNTLALIDGNENKVSSLVVAASNPDNLCRMDPAWHPWL